MDLSMNLVRGGVVEGLATVAARGRKLAERERRDLVGWKLVGGGDSRPAAAATPAVSRSNSMSNVSWAV
ncbi:uncharacterized protein PADG_11975 [Paracoccidioides brasiliensis Pb18]|uniref:Uncharacterized protein n=1 Tax=Paracoccidioides brasiliensis (strain Pb18) TaxID=502780 RepID=A0A0A0HU51_PARBD|nr:uncharacterized protein PADG_11975 [Paracoccidioides brasiliensis Pb18]KGM91838.1 hypothetical protein PADG_11975 [Paracoccidioides brasiliensis Pb18]